MSEAGLQADGTLNIPLARAMKPLLRPARYKAARGGRGSMKSHTFADMLIEEAVLDGEMRAVCIREVQKSLRQSSKLLLEDKIRAYGLEGYFRIMRDEIRMRHGNGLIIFQGMQDHTAESIKSLEGFKIGWVAEAQSLSARSLRLLRPTFRQTPGMPDPPQLWFDWNPTNEDDAVEEFFDGNKHPDERNPPPSSIVVDVSWRDNPWFPQDLREEKDYDWRRDPEMAAHVWDGAYEQRSDARVFNNWRVEEFETPDDAEFMFGADWGYSVDPVVLVRCFASGRTLFIDQELYKVGLEIDHTPLFFGGMHNRELIKKNRQSFEALQARGIWFNGIPGCEQWEIVADSARPETISYMKRHGFPRMVPSIKGPNSIQEGVEFLREFDIVIHPRVKHAVREFTHYKYKTDKHTGVVLPLLQDKENHYIDSVRYAVEKRRRNRKRMGTW